MRVSNLSASGDIILVSFLCCFLFVNLLSGARRIIFCRYIVLVQVPKYYTRNNLSWINSMADEEPVDQKKYFEESCKPKCVKLLLEYQACVKRIEGDESGHKHCTGQYFDYWSCIDKCVAPKLFPKLK
ncbi:hypothetical protein SAY86_017472 [Trapa natans]|uniref:Complex III subunit VI n=1 Tax=Trapa natans TaxID=22666 RepID=A0AAN7LKM1_TRANT|nr:hypothetical protein SAY86_017472 [Trapa natans]